MISASPDIKYAKFSIQPPNLPNALAVSDDFDELLRQPVIERYNFEKELNVSLSRKSDLC